MRVLIADDSKLMRERIRSSIIDIGNVEIISETENGLDTYRELCRQDPDLAIIDIRMPGMNGLEVLKEFRLNNKKTRILILTNYFSEQYKKRAFENGADYFLNKAEDFDKIAEIVNDFPNSPQQAKWHCN